MEGKSEVDRKFQGACVCGGRRNMSAISMYYSVVAFEELFSWSVQAYRWAESLNQRVEVPGASRLHPGVWFEDRGAGREAILPASSCHYSEKNMLAHERIRDLRLCITRYS